MREILFRGKRKNGNGEWLYGDLLHDYWVHGDTVMPCAIRYKINSSYSFPIEVIPETVGQFTGLHDKNGKMVFEGDYDANYDVIAWCNNRQGWAMKAYDFPTDDFMLCHCYQCEGNFEINDIDMSLEIIGNIHDKPELIKQGGSK